MNKRQYVIANIILGLIAVVLLHELIRDASKTGDFMGYVNAGSHVFYGENIYSDPINTWPPFFSVFSVPLAMGDEISSYFIRFIWLVGSLVAMYYALALTTQLVFHKPLVFRKHQAGIMIQDPLVLVPLILLLRYIMDNMMNVQINMYMLFCSLLAITFFTQKKYAWAGMLIGLTISLKVYTIFFVFYFLFKREFKVVGWTLLAVLLFNLIPLPVFGYDQYIAYYVQWINEVAPHSFFTNHTNQSLFAMFLRFLSPSHNELNLMVNFLEMKPHAVKLLTYAVVCLASIYPAYVFRRKLKDLVSLNSIVEYSLVFSIIPLLSPVSWKAYFIFLWLPYFLTYALLYRTDSTLAKSTHQWLRGCFWVSVGMTVFSSELFLGIHLSDVLEVWSIVTVGAIVLLFVQFYIALHVDKFDVSTVKILHPPD